MVNVLSYGTMINEFLSPELEDMDVDDVYFQQDGAMCDTSGKRSREGHISDIVFYYQWQTFRY